VSFHELIFLLAYSISEGVVIMFTDGKKPGKLVTPEAVAAMGTGDPNGGKVLAKQQSNIPAYTQKISKKHYENFFSTVDGKTADDLYKEAEVTVGIIGKITKNVFERENRTDQVFMLQILMDSAMKGEITPEQFYGGLLHLKNQVAGEKKKFDSRLGVAIDQICESLQKDAKTLQSKHDANKKLPPKDRSSEYSDIPPNFSKQNEDILIRSFEAFANTAPKFQKFTHRALEGIEIKKDTAATEFTTRGKSSLVADSASKLIQQLGSAIVGRAESSMSPLKTMVEGNNDEKVIAEQLEALFRSLYQQQGGVENLRVSILKL